MGESSNSKAPKADKIDKKIEKLEKEKAKLEKERIKLTSEKASKEAARLEKEKAKEKEKASKEAAKAEKERAKRVAERAEKRLRAMYVGCSKWSGQPTPRYIYLKQYDKKAINSASWRAGVTLRQHFEDMLRDDANFNPSTHYIWKFMTDGEKERFKGLLDKKGRVIKTSEELERMKKGVSGGPQGRTCPQGGYEQYQEQQQTRSADEQQHEDEQLKQDQNDFENDDDDHDIDDNDDDTYNGDNDTYNGENDTYNGDENDTHSGDNNPWKGGNDDDEKDDNGGNVNQTF